MSEQNITLYPGDQLNITVGQAENPNEPLQFNTAMLPNPPAWRQLTINAASDGDTVITFGSKYVSGDRNLTYQFRFTNIKTKEEYFVDAPEGFRLQNSVQTSMIKRGNRLVMWSGAETGRGVRAYEFELDGNEVKLVDTESFGDENSRTSSAFIELESGALVGMWWELYALRPDYKQVLGVAYRSPDGVWSFIDQIVMDDDHLGGGLTNMINSCALVQHPTDGRIWGFYKRDSFHSISGLRLKETPSGIEIDELLPDILSVRALGWDKNRVVQGENPSLEAVVCKDRDSFILGYQCRVEHIFRIEYHPEFGYLMAFVKGAWLTYAEFQSDGSFEHFPPLEVWHERNADHGLIYRHGKLWVTHWQVDESVPNVNTVPLPMYGSSYDFDEGKWSEPTELATMVSDGLNMTNMRHVEAVNLPVVLFPSTDNRTALVYLGDS